jgi:hypothetical protein
MASVLLGSKSFLRPVQAVQTLLWSQETSISFQNLLVAKSLNQQVPISMTVLELER